MNHVRRLRAVLAAFICAAQPVSSALSELSVYQLESSWTEDSGRPLQLRALAGDVQVVTLFFTTCTGSCPATVKGLQMFSRNLPADVRQHTRFLLVTVDPKRDTLAALREYRRKMKLAAGRFRLVRSAPEDVRELAAVLGFNYEQIDSGQYMHSNLITVLDRRGQITHQQSGIADGQAVIDAIRQALPPQK